MVKKPQREIIGWGGRVSQIPVFHNTHKRVIYAFAYINYYKTFEKRKRKYKRKPKSLSNGFLVSAWLSLRACLRGLPLCWPVLASLVQHSRTPEPALSFNQESDLQHHPQLLFLLSSAVSSLWNSGSSPSTVSELSLLHFHTLPDLNGSLLPSDNHPL